MSSAFCSLDEAFIAPIKAKGKKSRREHFVPGPLSGSPDQEAGSVQSQSQTQAQSVPDAMSSPQPTAAGSRPEAASALSEFFPLPGETADSEEWTKAFTLAPSQMPGAMGGVPVDGKSTLWRKVPTAQALTPAPLITTNMSPLATNDIQRRLDALTRQLESLTSSATTPMQSTAELFLFIAIGLLLLLAIDTLLRCATSVAVAKSVATAQAGGGWGRVSRPRFR
jgi:hypothetical protein